MRTNELSFRIVVMLSAAAVTAPGLGDECLSDESPFDDKTVQLARMFADQSAIAIENARMMSELRSKIGPAERN